MAILAWQSAVVCGFGGLLRISELALVREQRPNYGCG